MQNNKVRHGCSHGVWGAGKWGPGEYKKNNPAGKSIPAIDKWISFFLEQRYAEHSQSYTRGCIYIDRERKLVPCAPFALKKESSGKEGGGISLDKGGRTPALPPEDVSHTGCHDTAHQGCQHNHEYLPSCRSSSRLMGYFWQLTL